MAAPGAWAAAADATRSIPDGTDVAAFDGSFNGDTTVLVVATVHGVFSGIFLGRAAQLWRLALPSQHALAA